jgi:hypothetical protein
MMSAAETSATPALRVELLITADFPDGRPLLPPCDYGVVWHVVRRGDGRTTWRRIFLELHSGDRLAPDVGNFKRRAPQERMHPNG